MHETVIARRIIDDAQKKAGKGGEIESIILDVGELGPIHDHELREILETLTKWKIKIKEIKAKAKCNCGHSGHPKVLERGHEFCLYVCEKCGKVPKLYEGGDIRIRQVTVKKAKKVKN
ncbi:MAG: hypothetical protein QS98_C0011G0077 [archaeon GW2011_AR3]|nr:MAG: hypothetical protein QS98_C0011G0077 [archaeon GW2011_AR3]MBS3109658.1 hydrogenase maturation nickel metallochaperone HypA [Candidatus Woesearchaeota archaeon]